MPSINISTIYFTNYISTSGLIRTITSLFNRLVLEVRFGVCYVHMCTMYYLTTLTSTGSYENIFRYSH